MGIERAFKNSAKSVFYCSGIYKFLLRFSSFYLTSRILILAYHRVSSSIGDRAYMSLPAEVFERHIRFIKENFEPVPLGEALKAVSKNDRGKIYAAITIDDGYMDNYLYAYPVLKKYGVPATIFLTTDFIGTRHVFWWDRIFNILLSPGAKDAKVTIDSKSFYLNSDGFRQTKMTADRLNAFLRTKNEREIDEIILRLEKQFSEMSKPAPCEMLGWKEIREMSGNGITFGSHTKTHRNLCLLKDEEVFEELIGSKRKIEKKICSDVTGLAYPFGIFDERVKDIVREAGFGYARTNSGRCNFKDSDGFSLSSISAGSITDTSSLAAKLFLDIFKK